MSTIQLEFRDLARLTGRSQLAVGVTQASIRKSCTFFLLLINELSHVHVSSATSLACILTVRSWSTCASCPRQTDWFLSSSMLTPVLALHVHLKTPLALHACCNAPGHFSGSTITLGARGDSYYEYLLKQWLQSGKVRPAALC